MKKQKSLYPGIDEVEKIKNNNYVSFNSEMPDFIGNAPNYEKFKTWETEKVLVWLNID